MELSKDFREFIELLNKKEVKYLIVGGYAFTALVYPRNTGDIDFFILNDKENTEKITEVISEFGLESLNIKPEDLQEDDLIVQLGFPPRRIDIITNISGVKFDDAWKNKIVNENLGVRAYFIGYEDFIANKTASGRKKDLADVEEMIKSKVKPKK